MFLIAATAATLTALLAAGAGEWGTAFVCGTMAFLFAFARP
jgi:hypothetical protein